MCVINAKQQPFGRAVNNPSCNLLLLHYKGGLLDWNGSLCECHCDGVAVDSAYCNRDESRGRST
jgi:hypothetical protein